MGGTSLHWCVSSINMEFSSFSLGIWQMIESDIYSRIISLILEILTDFLDYARKNLLI